MKRCALRIFFFAAPVNNSRGKRARAKNVGAAEFFEDWRVRVKFA
jgi:hypothetical protein